MICGALVEDASAALMFTNGMWEGQFYARLVTVASVVLVRQDGRDLVDRWARLYDHDTPVDQVVPREWFWDQVTLFLAWCESPLPIANIPIAVFADVQLDGHSAIWAANVPDKERVSFLPGRVQATTHRERGTRFLFPRLRRGVTLALDREISLADKKKQEGPLSPSCRNCERL